MLTVVHKGLLFARKGPFFIPLVRRTTGSVVPRIHNIILSSNGQLPESGPWTARAIKKVGRRGTFFCKCPKVVSRFAAAAAATASP